MLIVKKFGGTSVANKERIYNVANRCVEEYKKGNDVVVVLSAMGKYTDELITMAEDINEKPPKREMDMLFTIGEQMSVSLMAMALDKLGVPAVSLNAFQVSMHTTSVHGNARLKRIDTERIRRELENRKIVVVTGFQGINKYDDYTTLGRGGSDTTAVALAAALHADACEIYTDVDGVYTVVKPALHEFASITFEDVCREFVREMQKQNMLPFRYSKMGRWTGKTTLRDKTAKNGLRIAETEIDLLCIDQKGENYMVGECKFKKEPFTYTEYLNTLSKLTPLKEKTQFYYALFSESGFDEKIVEDLKENKTYIYTLSQIVNYK